MDIEKAKSKLHKFLGDEVYNKVMKAMEANFNDWTVSDLIVQTNRETAMNNLALERIIYDDTDFFANYYKQHKNLLYKTLD